MASQAIGVFWIVAFSTRVEQRKVPVFGHIPVERVERVQKDEKQPDGVSATSD